MAQRHRVRRKPLIVTIAVVVIVAGSVGAWARTRTTAAASTTTTRTVAATVETLKQTVSATGTIEPKTQSDLSFASSGTVTAVKVAVGDVVTVGQTLATIDPTSLEDARALAQANLDAATTALTSSEASGTTTQIAAAQAQVDSTTSKLASAQTDLAGATMTSPIAGTVAAVNLTAGTAATSGSSGGAAAPGGSSGSGSGAGNGSSGSSSSSGSNSPAQVVVISTSAWIVDASVGSADLASVKKGLQATITPTDASAPIFGTVSTVGIIASSGTSGSATFPVTIAVTGHPAGLYAGGSADVSIVIKQIADAVTVPTAAVRSNNGQSVVELVRNGSAVSTPVTLGLVSGATTQIIKGVSEGDQVQIEIRSFGGAGGTGGTGQTGQNRRQGTGGTGGTGFGGFRGGGPGQGGTGRGAPAQGAPGAGQ